MFSTGFIRQTALYSTQDGSVAIRPENWALADAHEYLAANLLHPIDTPSSIGGIELYGLDPLINYVWKEYLV